MDTSYDGLRTALENIIRGNLSLANSIVVAETTVRKRGESVSLLSRAYPFSLNRYFDQIIGKKENEYVNSNYGGGRVQWC